MRQREVAISTPCKMSYHDLNDDDDGPSGKLIAILLLMAIIIIGAVTYFWEPIINAMLK